MDEPASTAELSPDRMNALWRRLKDHRIAQWTVGYVAVAYGIQHAVTLTSEAFDWPHAVTRLSMLLLALGLPLAMTLAWYHGERASRRMSTGEFSILSVLLFGVSILFYAYVQPSPESVTGPAPTVQQASVTAARAAAASPKGAISVAVLPFLNLSSDKDQEFFSDGMTEEITAALAKVPDLRVVARTSAFEFKGKNIEIEKIGQQLHATHLIEGSVRKAGNRLRITAQLIKADDGTHIWAEDYDRELTDVFAIQEDIARAITASLHMTLGLKPGENLVNNRNIDPASHDEYLRAVALYLGRSNAVTTTGAAESQAVSLLENVVARNPGYAPAWASLSVVYGALAADHAGNFNEPLDQARATVNTLRDKAEIAARKALALDPDSGVAYIGLAAVVWSRGRLLEAEPLYQKASALDSSLGLGYALRLGSNGRVRDALEIMERVMALDPFDPQYLAATVTARWVAGDDDGAMALAKTARPLTRAPLVAMIYASQGRLNDAADALSEIATGPNSPAAKATALLRKAPSHVSDQPLPRLPPAFEFVYLYAGAPDRSFATYERRLDAGVAFGGLARVWHVSYAAFRKSERFKVLVRRSGIVDYWSAKGWPLQCHPTTGDDFECS